MRRNRKFNRFNWLFELNPYDDRARCIVDDDFDALEEVAFADVVERGQMLQVPRNVETADFLSV